MRCRLTRLKTITARAEIGSLADKKATQVYSGSHADGVVVAQRCTNAIENYKAAVACFVRALPYLTDERSAELVRAEIRRLLERLGELNKILKETDPTNPLVEEGSEESENDKLILNNRLLADLKFKVGDEVEVDEGKKLGRIASVDLENGTYGIDYDDGSEEATVIESRVRARTSAGPSSADKGFESANEYERFKIWSEIVESERLYRDSLNQLINHYIIPLDNPMYWGGAKSKVETVFTQKTVTSEERQQIFGNVEDLAGTSALVLNSLESRFTKWEADQKLADGFLQFASLYESGYPLYAEAYYSSQSLVRQIKRDRSSFEAVLNRAQTLGAPPLELLMKLPLERPGQCRQLLLSLAQRTSEDHPDARSIRDAFVLFGRVEELISASLNQLKLEAELVQIEQKFSPQVKLAKKGRYLVKFDGNIKRIEGSTAHTRLVWLFNDLILVGRKSEWLNVGFYRHILQFFVVKARVAPEFGPLAFEVAGKTESCVFVAFDENDKQEWLNALRGYIPSKRRSIFMKNKTNRKSAPPRPPAASTPSSNSTNLPFQPPAAITPRAITSPPPAIAAPRAPNAIKLPTPLPARGPVWYRARAKYSYSAQEIGDLPFTQGDILEVCPEQNPPGWSKAKIVGRDGVVGQIPSNYIEPL